MWAAESTPIAMPDTTGTPAAVRPRPSARATSSPYDVPRRAPDDRDGFLPVERAGVAGDVEHGGRVGELAQPLGIRVVAAADGGEPGGRDAFARATGRESRVRPGDAAGAV